MQIENLITDAKDILVQRESLYGKYSEFMNLYSKIIFNLRIDLAILLKAKKKEYYAISDNIAHNVALKLSRILQNPNYEDSYLDTIGYLILFLRNTDAEHIKIRALDFLDSNHKVNKFIESINKNLSKEKV